jgi:hypothetical protein
MHGLGEVPSLSLSLISLHFVQQILLSLEIFLIKLYTFYYFHLYIASKHSLQGNPW